MPRSGPAGSNPRGRTRASVRPQAATERSNLYRERIDAGAGGWLGNRLIVHGPVRGFGYSPTQIFGDLGRAALASEVDQIEVANHRVAGACQRRAHFGGLRRSADEYQQHRRAGSSHDQPRAGLWSDTPSEDTSWYSWYSR